MTSLHGSRLSALAFAVLPWAKPRLMNPVVGALYGLGGLP